jgi:hypothetical protein
MGMQVLLLSFDGFRGEEEQIQNEQNGTDGDGGISHVKGGPAVAAEPYFEEVCDSSVKNSVSHVSGGSAEQESKACAGHGSALAGNQQPRERANYRQCADRQENTEPGGMGIRKHAECDSRIAAVDQVNEVAHHFVAPGFVGLRFEPRFGGAIGYHNSER